MNLCIDQGNSSSKIGLFDKNTLIDSFIFKTINFNDIYSLLNKYKIDACILSSVISDNYELKRVLNEKININFELSSKTSIPVKNRYETPDTLGKDRLAAVVGASFLKPETDILVIDAGTAITYDFIDAKGNYEGGNIAPGVDMRLRSLHEFTQKLPLVSPSNDNPFLGKNTKSALISGAIYGIVFEIDGYINTLKIKYPQLSTFLTGGSIFYFDNKLKNAIFAEKNLVLIGLNRILQYNVQK
ncbi:MAG: type III pantothenate kinase [Paludibacter sp.]|nr:type III pantothenate kinase [Paludibacter sp.]